MRYRVTLIAARVLAEFDKEKLVDRCQAIEVPLTRRQTPPLTGMPVGLAETLRRMRESERSDMPF